MFLLNGCVQIVERRAGAGGQIVGENALPSKINLNMQFIQRIYNSLYPLFYERSEENRGVNLAEHSSGTYF